MQVQADNHLPGAVDLQDVLPLQDGQAARFLGAALHPQLVDGATGGLQPNERHSCNDGAQQGRGVGRRELPTRDTRASKSGGSDGRHERQESRWGEDPPSAHLGTVAKQSQRGEGPPLEV